MITVRNAAGVLQCFGPDNGRYEPSLRPGWTKQHEPDEAAVLDEWAQLHPASPDKRQQMLTNPAVPQWFKDWLA